MIVVVIVSVALIMIAPLILVMIVVFGVALILPVFLMLILVVLVMVIIAFCCEGGYGKHQSACYRANERELANHYFSFVVDGEQAQQGGSRTSFSFSTTD